MNRQFVTLLILILISATAFAYVTEGQMKIFAVTSEGQGMTAQLKLQIEPGEGNIWSATKSLSGDGAKSLVGTSTQTTEWISVKLAKNYVPDVERYDYKYTIISEASLVDGPSAGGAMALLTISMLQGKQLPDYVSMTGTITEEGYIGPVGGTFEKAKAASKSGIKLFMIPKGEAKQIVKLESGVQSINLLEFGPKELGIKIAEVGTIDDVIKYSFTDPEQIVVEAEEVEHIPDFVPEPIEAPESLEPMKALTKKHLDEVKNLVNESRKSLNTTLLDNPRITNELLVAQADAENKLKQAEILYGQNYLYSSANFAFLSRVTAMLIKDVAENPAILTPNSTIFELKLSNLRQDILRLKNDLQSGGIPLDNLEWHISAQQRLSYAEKNIDGLLNTQTVVVGSSGVVDDATVAIEDIQKYESARAWLAVADDLYEITQKSQKRVKHIDAFESEVNDILVEVENKFATLDKDDVEDITRRFESAKNELKQGWKEAALFDAASALALTNAALIVKDKDMNSLEALLERNISDVKENMKNSKYNYVWPELYIAHANYYLEEARYYLSLNQGAKAISSLKGGISLSYLAEALRVAADNVYKGYETAKPEEVAINNGKENGKSDGSGITIKQPAYSIPPTIFIAIIVPLVILIIVLVLIIVKKIFHTGDESYIEASIPREIKEIKNILRKLDESLAEGKISEEKYNELVGKYKSELNDLQQLKDEESEHLIELDKFKAEMLAFEKRLRDLKKHYNEGIISSSDYKELAEEYRQKLSDLSEAVRAESVELEFEQQKLKSIKEGKAKVQAIQKRPSQKPKKKQK